MKKQPVGKKERMEPRSWHKWIKLCMKLAQVVLKINIAFSIGKKITMREEEKFAEIQLDTLFYTCHILNYLRHFFSSLYLAPKYASLFAIALKTL